MKIDIRDKIYDLLITDDGYSSGDNIKLENYFRSLDEESRKKIDKVFLYLVGYKFSSIVDGEFPAHTIAQESKCDERVDKKFSFSELEL